MVRRSILLLAMVLTAGCAARTDLSDDARRDLACESREITTITRAQDEEAELASVNPSKPAEGPTRYGLEECIQIALENNHRRRVSRFAVHAARAQHEQALASYWPRLSARLGYSLLDEDPLFVVPASVIATPPITIPGVPIVIPGQRITVPKQKIKLADRQTGTASLELNYPVYTGGLRSAITKQAEYGVEAAKEDERRTNHRVIYDVRRIYYGAILARELLHLGRDTLSRLEVTLDLTERLYKGGSGRVKKTDFLRNKVIVEATRSAVASLRANERVARSALSNILGLDWTVAIEPRAADIPFAPSELDLPTLVAVALKTNPDWQKVSWGIKAAHERENEARSEYWPKVFMTGRLTHIQNSYDHGVVNSQNRDSWMVGAGLDFSIFSGWSTDAKVREARARLAKIVAQKELLRLGLALQLKDVTFRLEAAEARTRAADAGKQAAENNRELNERAYRDELVETKDVLESFIMESLMKAEYFKSLYDHVETQARVEFIVGEKLHHVFGDGNAAPRIEP